MVAQPVIPDRTRAAKLAEGAGIGVAFWCVLFTFQLLPAFTGDPWGIGLFAIAGAVLRATRFGPVLSWLLVLSGAVVLIVATTSLSNALADRWIRADQLPDSAVAAVIVLSAGLKPDTTINAEGVDRLISGLELVRAGKAPLLVTTTLERTFAGGRRISGVPDQARLIELFGSGTRWERVSAGMTTRDEALSSARLLLPRGARTVAVVTSPMHTRRACSAFEAVGFSVVCIAARERVPGGRSPPPWPRDRVASFGDWVYEVAGMAKYSLEGWLGKQPAK